MGLVLLGLTIPEVPCVLGALSKDDAWLTEDSLGPPSPSSSLPYTMTESYGRPQCGRRPENARPRVARASPRCPARCLKALPKLRREVCADRTLYRYVQVCRNGNGPTNTVRTSFATLRGIQGALLKPRELPMDSQCLRSAMRSVVRVSLGHILGEHTLRCCCR